MIRKVDLIDRYDIFTYLKWKLRDKCKKRQNTRILAGEYLPCLNEIHFPTYLPGLKYPVKDLSSLQEVVQYRYNLQVITANGCDGTARFQMASWTCESYAIAFKMSK